MTPNANISFPGQDHIRNDFLHCIQNSPIDHLSKDLILTHSDQLSPILMYPPLECFPQHKTENRETWKALCLCSAYSLLFFTLCRRSAPKNQNLNGLSSILMVESQRICGSMFDLKHAFWKTFYRRIAARHDTQDIQKKEGVKKSISIFPYAQLSIYLLPIDALASSLPLSAFQYEMLEQSLMAMFKGFYNLDQKNITQQKKIFKEALTYAKDMPLVGYDRWINHYAHLTIEPKIKNL